MQSRRRTESILWRRHHDAGNQNNHHWSGKARPRRRSQKHTRRRVRLNGWTVAKYAALTVAGVLLFRAGAAYALTERGYKAIGGEVFALFLPVFYYTISAMVRDYITEIKSIFREEKDHEKTC